MKKIILVLFLLLTACNSEIKEVDNSLWEDNEISHEEIKSDLISSDSFSISFWFKSDSNKPSDTILTIGDENNYYTLKPSKVSFIDETYVYNGLTLSNKNEDLIISDKKFSLKSNRYNLIVINFYKKNIDIYLNGELASSGNVEKLKGNSLYIGVNPYENNVIQNGFYSKLNISKNILSKDKIFEEFKSELPRVLLDTINISDSDDLIFDYWIDSYEIEGYPVKWVSLNQELIDYRGVIMKKVEEDTEVELTATLEIDGYSTSKTFIVNLRVEDDNRLLIRDLKSLDTYINSYMHSNTKLPDTLSNGSKVKWSSDCSNIEIVDNVLIKLSENEKELCTINASVTKGDITVDKSYSVTILDEIYGYVMSYFNGELGSEVGHLAYSYDGLIWNKLNMEITTELGTTRIRDPKLTRDKDGEFIYLATEGFDNPSIYIIKAPGLLDFSNQKLIQVAYYDEGLRMTGERAWAPEIYYDHTSEQYYIYFSDSGFVDEFNNKGGPIYAVTSKDLENMSYPFIYFNPGYSVIDGTIISLDGKYWLFYKDERKAAQTIFYASSDDLKGFNKAYDEYFLSLIKYMEGPFMFKNKDGGYFLYMDNYPKGTFYGASFTTLGEENDITWYDKEDIVLPEEDTRHGSVIEVTKKELDAIIKKYK